MSSRVEFLRGEIIASGSPLARHSLNQHRMKLAFEGEARVLGRPRKVIMAERRLEALEEYEKAKQARVLNRVLAVKYGQYDGFCDRGFSHEVRYLRTHGILPNHPDNQAL